MEVDGFILVLLTVELINYKQNYRNGMDFSGESAQWQISQIQDHSRCNLPFKLGHVCGTEEPLPNKYQWKLEIAERNQQNMC